MKSFALILLLTISLCEGVIYPWNYICENNEQRGYRCIKDKPSNIVTGNKLSFAECKLTCGNDALFWPLPRQLTSSYQVTVIDPDKISYSNINDLQEATLISYLNALLQRQNQWLKNKNEVDGDENDSNTSVGIEININDQSLLIPLSTTDESYDLKIKQDQNGNIVVTIDADNYFGVRHAIETLFQAFEYDDIRNAYISLNDVEISDKPEFSHRGLLLDTSRSFITKDVIENILEGMAHSKLNVFHWHLTDTHSFPVELKADPINQMTQYGAYDAKSIYTQDEIKDIVNFANQRGIQVIPEFDQPAHVGNGWNFPGAEDLVLCFNIEPWSDYCHEPPCGQFDPTKNKTFTYLGQIYEEYFEMFNYEIFHMGADEVSFECWRDEKVLDFMVSKGYLDEKDKNDEKSQDEGFIFLWRDFMKNSRDKLMEVSPNAKTIIWTSTITLDGYLQHVPSDEYVIQIWTDKWNQQIDLLIEEKYEMIFSNYDSLYLDCGYAAWIGEGTNWCPPYKGWQDIYSNDLYGLVTERNIELTQEIKDLIWGSEVAMWTEQVDSESVEGKIFPRADALGERLWSNPSSSFSYAETRMLHQRNRLVQRGVHADVIQPDWCFLNENQCYAVDDKGDGGDGSGGSSNLNLSLTLLMLITFVIMKFY